MSRISDIAGHRFVAPAAATQEESSVRLSRGRSEKKLLDPSLTVGQTIAKKGQVAAKARIRRPREVGRWVEGIVHRNASPGAKSFVRLDHWLTAAIREDEIISR